MISRPVSRVQSDQKNVENSGAVPMPQSKCGTGKLTTDATGMAQAKTAAISKPRDHLCHLWHVFYAHANDLEFRSTDTYDLNASQAAHTCHTWQQPLEIKAIPTCGMVVPSVPYPPHPK